MKDEVINKRRLLLQNTLDFGQLLSEIKSDVSDFGAFLKDVGMALREANEFIGLYEAYTKIFCDIDPEELSKCDPTFINRLLKAKKLGVNEKHKLIAGQKVDGVSFSKEITSLTASDVRSVIRQLERKIKDRDQKIAEADVLLAEKKEEISRLAQRVRGLKGKGSKDLVEELKKEQERLRLELKAYKEAKIILIKTLSLLSKLEISIYEIGSQVSSLALPQKRLLRDKIKSIRFSLDDLDTSLNEAVPETMGTISKVMGGQKG